MSQVYVVLRPFNGIDIGAKITPTAFHADYLKARGLIAEYVGEPFEAPVNRMMTPASPRRGRPRGKSSL